MLGQFLRPPKNDLSQSQPTARPAARPAAWLAARFCLSLTDLALASLIMGAPTSGRASSTVRTAVSKVPEITIGFWVVKVLTTGMGETTSDFLARSIGPGIAVPMGGLAFAATMLWQLSRRGFFPWPYWAAVSMVSVFGTMVADVLHVGLGIPYLVSTVAFSVTLAVVFWAWYAREGTLSIHSITTRRRELFYWVTVLATFALGTAAGDMTATTLHLGYFGSGLLFAGLIAAPAIGHWRFGLDPVVAFWSAYVVTRPLGASFADWAAVPGSRGGLDIGYGTVSIALALLIVALVAAWPRLP